MRVRVRLRLSDLHEHENWLQVHDTAPTALPPRAGQCYGGSIVYLQPRSTKTRLRCDDKTEARRLEDSRMGALDLIKVEAVDTHT